MKISLIGMSGSGKSHWSKKLEGQGFQRFCIDDLLEKKLETALKQLGYQGLTDLAKWMRQPYEDRYARTSATYLEYEQKTMHEVIGFLEDHKQKNQDVVVDTTGSVIYIDPNILRKLSELTTIIYLETPQSVQQEMYELYKKDPKPVIWGKSFSKKSTETNSEALARCYPKLLAFRTMRYKKLADVTLQYDELHNERFQLQKFISDVTV